MSADGIWSLISNAALLLALAALYDMVLNRADRLLPLKNLLVGAVIGTIGITIMLNPWSFVPGLVFDTRSILLSVAALFFGTVPALIAALMTAAFRILQGGAGVAVGVAVIIASVVIGLGWRYHRPQGEKTFAPLELYLFGCIVHVVMLICMLLLPWPMAINALSHISVPVLLGYPLATVLLGMLLKHKLTQREAESLVRTRERRFHRMIERGGDIILLIDPRGRISYVSESILRILGYPVEEVMGRGPTENVYPVDIPIFLDLLSSLRQTPGASRSLRLRVRHRDGRWLWLDMTLTNLLNDPAVEAMVVNARDLSERKLIEMQIEQQAGEIADLYETSRRLGASLALEDVARAAVERVREMLNPDLVLLFLVRGDTLYLKAHAPGEGPLSPRIAPGQFVGAALGKLAAASGRPVYSLDAREDRHCDPREAQQAGVISQAAVPLGSGGRVIGVMVLATASERDFQPQATFFEALAEPLAMALGNALAHEAMQRHAAELEAQVAGPTGQLKAANRKIEVFS